MLQHLLYPNYTATYTYSCSNFCHLLFLFIFYEKLVFYIPPGDTPRSESDQGGLMTKAESDSVCFFFLLRIDRLFFCFLVLCNSSPVPSLPSDGELLLTTTRCIHFYFLHYQPQYIQTSNGYRCINQKLHSKYKFFSLDLFNKYNL